MRWQYLARDAHGRRGRGELDAATLDELTATLRARGLHAEHAAPAPTRRRRPIAAAELAPIMHGLAALLESGVPLDRAIAAIQPMASPALRTRLLESRRRLNEGASLATALDDQSGALPGATLAVLQAAERNGRLAQGLADVARSLDDEAALRRDLSQALAYPAMLAVVGTGAILVLLFVVLPRFASLLGDAGVALPTLTRGLLAVASAVREPRLAAGALVCLALAAVAVVQLRVRLSDQLLALPLIGPLRHGFATARSAQAFAAALGAGVPVLGALEAAGEAAADPAVERRLMRVRQSVAEGEPLAASLEKTGAWRASVLPVIGIGEANGTLQRMAERAAVLAGGESLAALRSATRLVEPVLVLAFGGLVALVAAGMLQAVYALRPG